MIPEMNQGGRTEDPFPPVNISKLASVSGCVNCICSIWNEREAQIDVPGVPKRTEDIG
jgi:hypothetical protein